MRSISSPERFSGRHISRRLQLAQVTSNLRAAVMPADCVRPDLMFLSKAMTACMVVPLLVLLDLVVRARGDGIAHFLEFGALVEKSARSQAHAQPLVGRDGE